ncbi:MAG TPA: hypothetical protein VF279_06290 [Acidimicrobiales bacterium]
MGHAVRTGHTALVGAGTDQPLSAADLLARPQGSSTGEVDVYVSTELLADLHAPRLVITPEYVGPERRHRTRATAIDLPDPWSPPRVDRGWFVRPLKIVVVAAVTVAVAVPLILMATQGTMPTHPVPVATAVQSSTGGAAAHAARAARSEAARLARVVRAGRHQAEVAAASARRTARHAAQAARVDAARSAHAARQMQAAARRTARADQRAARAVARTARTAQA